MKLKAWLREQMMTQAMFAKKLGTDQAQVSHLASGKVTPTLATIALVEKATKGAVTYRDWAPKGAK